jgi:hypothetical protein
MGSIPAWAGETAQTASRHRRHGVHPRVGGGDLPIEILLVCYQGPSPRGRGRRGPPDLDRLRLGSIPAWAGETRPGSGMWCWRRVHPRVGGGDVPAFITGLLAYGPSPRGRGRPVPVHHPARETGSIPAWAGETLICNTLSNSALANYHAAPFAQSQQDAAATPPRRNTRRIPLTSANSTGGSPSTRIPSRPAAFASG